MWLVLMVDGLLMGRRLGCLASSTWILDRRLSVWTVMCSVTKDLWFLRLFLLYWELTLG